MSKPLTSLPIDISLLDGLESAMTEDEQRAITASMTSGDADKVAEAATQLSNFASLLKRGVLPAGRTAHDTDSIRVAQETSYTNNVAVFKAMLEEKKDGTINDIRLQEREIKERKRLHPPPTRMPRHVKIEAFELQGNKKDGLLGKVGLPTMEPVPVVRKMVGKGPLGRRDPPSLKLLDDEWDGSLDDAYTKIKIKGIEHDKIFKEKIDNPGVQHVLEAAKDTKLEDQPVPRVVIAHVNNDAAKSGLRAGDVISHVNGEGFVGSSEDLLKTIDELKQSGQSKIELVVNADPCVAHALYYRAIS